MTSQTAIAAPFPESTSCPSRKSRAAWITWIVIALVCVIGLGWSALALANPSTECTPTVSFTVASGGTHVVDDSNCSIFGFDAMPVSPSHGSVPDVDPGFGNATGIATYHNNGDGATSDTFTLWDDTNGSIVVTVTILGASPIAGAVSATVAANSSNNPITLNLSGGTATSVAVATAASHGTAVASGTTIHYTPTAGYGGADSFTYTATNGSGTSAPATVTVTVSAPTIGVGPATLPAGVAGSAYSQVVTASNGAPPYSFAIAAGALPGGVTLSAGGALSGTPAAAGTYTFTVRATDADSYTGTRAYTWIVNLAAPVANAVSTTVAANSSSNPVTLSLSGGTATSVAVASAASHGTATASGTTITYTPTAGYGGTDSFTYTATNVTGTSSPATVTVTVSAPTIVLAPSMLTTAVVGTAYSQTVTASGGTPPYTFSISTGSLPAGVSLNPSGGLSGTPVAAGTSTFTLQATDGNSFTGTLAYSWTVNPAVPVAGAVSATVAANSSADPVTLNLSGGAAASVAIASAASHGTATASGTSITYTPTAGYGGADSFTYTATNVTGTSSAATVTITVSAPTITVAPASIPTGTAGTPSSQAITASGGTAPYSFAIGTGTLPGGVTLSAGGTLSGTPAAAGSYSFTIVATDSNVYTGTGTYTWVVNPAAPIAGSVAATVTSNTSNDPITLNLSGGTAASVAVAAAASHGTATASSTSITYTPTSGYAGPDSFTYTATNITATSAPATVTVTVSAPTITVAPVTLTVAVAGSAYSQAITASGGTSPYAYTITTGALPAGLTLTNGGALSGTPTTAGAYSFTVRAADANSNTGSRAYSWTVNPAAPIAGAVSATLAANSSSDPITLSLSGGAATSVAVASAASHGTATASGTSITYTPTAGYGGADSFTYTATNVTGTSSPATVSVTVTAPTIVLAPASIAAGTAGSPFAQTITATGGAPPYAYAIIGGALPGGVTLGAGGSLSGTPSAAGTYIFTIQATDANTNVGARSYSWTVNPAAPIVGAVAATVNANTSANPIALNVSGGAATNVTIASAASHGTATASGTSIAYTPVAGYSGSDSFTYTATNVTGTSVAATVTVTVSAVSVTVSPSTLTNGTAGIVYAQTITSSGGTSPYTYILAGGTLPSGVTLSAAGTLSGAPAAAGTYAFTVIATDSVTNTGSRAYAWVVGAALPTAANVAATVASNTSADPIAPSLGGGVATGVAVASAASHGTAIATGTTIAYTPTAGYSGPDSFTYTATNGSGTSAPATATITVSAVTLAVNPSTLGVAVVGTAYTQALTASGGTAGYSYTVSAGALPAGVALTAGGTLSGTPTVAGTYGFTIVAVDGSTNTGSRVYAWTVNPAAPTAGAVAATVSSNTTANAVALALGGGPTTSVAVAGAAGHGTAVASGTTIAYTPSSGYSGTDSFTYTATNATGTSVAATVTVTVTVVTLTVSPSTLRPTTVSAAYSQAFATSGGVSTITYRIGGGALPAGMTLTSAGVLAGAATTSGTYAFTVVATDASTNAGSEAYSLVVSPIAPAPPAVVQTVASNASRTPLRLQLDATGALSVVVRSQPSHGAVVAQGLELLYTPSPSYAGPDAFTYSVTTAAGLSDPAAVTLTVSPLSVTIAPASLPIAPSSRAVSVALQASGGVAPYQFATAYGALPPGLSLKSTGVLSGTPTADGLYAFTVTATDANGVVQSRDYTMSVARVDRVDPSTQAAVIGIVFAQIASTERFSDALLDNIGRHMDQVGWIPDLCGDLIAVGTSAAGTGPVVKPQMFASEPARPTRDEAATADQLACANGIPVWIGGSLQHGHASPTGNSGDGFSTSGVTVGADLPGPSWLAWGAALDYGRDRTDAEGLTSTSRAHSLLLALYGRVEPFTWLFVDGVAGGGRLAFTSMRQGDAGGPDLSGDRNGASWFGSIRVGNNLRYDAARLITYLRADFKAARLDEYSERGPIDLALTYQAMHWTSRAITAGARGSWDIPIAAGVLSPGGDLSFRHTGANDQVQRLFYADLGPSSQTYDLATVAVPQSTTTVTAGVKLRVRNGVVYAVEAGRSTGSTGLRQVGARASVQFGF